MNLFDILDYNKTAFLDLYKEYGEEIEKEENVDEVNKTSSTKLIIREKEFYSCLENVALERVSLCKFRELIDIRSIKNLMKNFHCEDKLHLNIDKDNNLYLYYESLYRELFNDFNEEENEEKLRVLFLFDKENLEKDIDFHLIIPIKNNYGLDYILIVTYLQSKFSPLNNVMDFIVNDYGESYPYIVRIKKSFYFTKNFFQKCKTYVTSLASFFNILQENYVKNKIIIYMSEEEDEEVKL